MDCLQKAARFSGHNFGLLYNRQTLQGSHPAGDTDAD
jgi:hypothetical protein